MMKFCLCRRSSAESSRRSSSRASSSEKSTSQSPEQSSSERSNAQPAADLEGKVRNTTELKYSVLSRLQEDRKDIIRKKYPEKGK